MSALALLFSLLGQLHHWSTRKTKNLTAEKNYVVAAAAKIIINSISLPLRALPRSQKFIFLVKKRREFWYPIFLRTHRQGTERGNVPRHRVLIIRFGPDRRWTDRQRTGCNFVILSNQTAEWITLFHRWVGRRHDILISHSRTWNEAQADRLIY